MKDHKSYQRAATLTAAAFAWNHASCPLHCSAVVRVVSIKCKLFSGTCKISQELANKNTN